MIVVQLHGGLGNQMFQAAAGLALADRLGDRLMFDFSRYRTKGLRAYALGPFALDADLMPTPPAFSGAISRVLNRLKGEKERAPGFRGVLYREPHFHVDPAFFTLSGDVQICGYFQSPRYFAGHEDTVRAALEPKKLASGRALTLAEQLAGDTSVAVHVRRGDYAADPRAAGVHGTLTDAYYDRAVARVLETVPAARFFVFSDTPAEAAALARRLPNAVVMAGESAGDDLFLMSCARHHVIANSSFSWWSAWLDRRPDGIRIAPKSWFTPEAAQTRLTDDLIPRDWVQL